MSERKDDGVLVVAAVAATILLCLLYAGAYGWGKHNADVWYASHPVVKEGPKCVLQLAPGTYRFVSIDLKGCDLIGAGVDKTRIESAPSAPPKPQKGSKRDCQYPDGCVTISRKTYFAVVEQLQRDAVTMEKGAKEIEWQLEQRAPQLPAWEKWCSDRTGTYPGGTLVGDRCVPVPPLPEKEPAPIRCDSTIPVSDGWQPLSTAPHDGTLVQIAETYGTVPWYGLYQFVDGRWVQGNNHSYGLSSEECGYWKPITTIIGAAPQPAEKPE